MSGPSASSDLREAARIHATRVGTASAKARGLDDWDDRALKAAETAERLYLLHHGERRSTERG